MRERSLAVRANALQRVHLAVRMAEHQGGSACRHPGHRARRKLGTRTHFHKRHTSERTMQRRKALLLGVSALLPACNRGGKPVVGVVPKGANHIFWQTVRAGALKAAREYGFDVEWNAPTLETDSSRQIEIVESMVNRRLAGIVLAPVDRKALVAVVERAAKAGIPVAIFDSGIDTEQRLTYIATDNTEGGRMAARKLGEILGGTGKVAVIGFMPGSASTMEREFGFEDEMKKKHPGVTLLGVQFGMGRSKAMSITENILTAHPDIDGLFADNESSTAGAVQALKSRNAKSVKLVAFDASDQILSDMKAGWIQALVVQNPFKMGYESTRAIGQKLRGEEPQKFMDSGATLVTPANMEEPAVKELLFPDIQKYLGRG
ncbi:MAG TPA: sugar ABC transporter substrate-binding protein [Solibacterales bacterium]|nr:sugar ABC transporter substrate-binding protein [Bryobacterales bacterium]